MFRRPQVAWFVGAMVLSMAFAPTWVVAAPKSSWLTTAVGTATAAGSATTSPSGRVTVTGEGTDIWSSTDGFQFAYQRLSGDQQITAKISSLLNTDGWAKGGIMMRQDLTAGSVHASLMVTPANGIVFQQRTTAGGMTTRAGVAGAAPQWLRLTRRGASITASVSSDGANWLTVGVKSVTMSADVVIGLAATSRYPSRLTTATFERVEVTEVAAGPPPPGPVAAWSFDDGVGNVLRASVGGLNGAVTGATWTTAGHSGGALVFDGVDDLVTVPAAAALNLSTGMTVEAWVYPMALANWCNVAMKEGQNDLAYALYANDAGSRPESVVNTGAGHLGATGPAQLGTNAWVHLAATFDGSTHRLFVNGVQVRSVAASGSLVQTAGPFRIGGNGVWGEWFNGVIDDLRIYDRALSASEVQADMFTAVAPPPPDTTAPVVAISSPVNGTTLSGTVNVTATASDDVGLASVQFQLNNVNFGAAVTAGPYVVVWNTQGVANGPYALTAVARDFAGNTSVSPSLTVTVSNAVVSVSGGRFVQFTSADHASRLPDGRPTVSGYTLEVWLPGSNTSSGTPYMTSNLGKPASTTTRITTDQQTFLATLPKAQEFFTTVTAIGPYGSARSAASNSFVMR